MDRLISLQAALEHIVHMELFGRDFPVVPVNVLKALPSAQPEITRCKDCKHGIDYYHEGDCYCSNPKWGLNYFGGSWEFYCGDAERRTYG